MRIKESKPLSLAQCREYSLKQTVRVTDISLDLRGLEPPEPLERVLTALSTLAPDQRLVILIPREPVPLYRILERNGYAHSTSLRDDGLFEVTIWEQRQS